MNNCIVNEQGKLLEILQEGQEKELEEGQFLVPLSNYYDVLNAERYDNAIWSFELKKWIGQGEQRPIIPPQPSETEILKEKIATQEMVIEELMFNIIPNITGGI